jgi:hypothetical protein
MNDDNRIFPDEDGKYHITTDDPAPTLSEAVAELRRVAIDPLLIGILKRLTRFVKWVTSIIQRFN